jgi:hypothetical protein
MRGEGVGVLLSTCLDVFLGVKRRGNEALFRALVATSLKLFLNLAKPLFFPI